MLNFFFFCIVINDRVSIYIVFIADISSETDFTHPLPFKCFALPSGHLFSFPSLELTSANGS